MNNEDIVKKRDLYEIYMWMSESLTKGRERHPTFPKIA